MYAKLMRVQSVDIFIDYFDEITLLLSLLFPPAHSSQAPMKPEYHRSQVSRVEMETALTRRYCIVFAQANLYMYIFYVI